MKTLYIFFIFLFSSASLFSQKEFNNWYFGDSAGISFNTSSGIPEALLDGKMMTAEGCASISDCSGNLLFYTDGITVWNNQHEIMKNGTGLFGDHSSSQSAIIVPLPKSNKLYYIFTLDAYWGINGFCYSIVDMNLDNGLGKIINKNIKIYNTIIEKQAAITHSNSLDIWIVTQDFKNKTFVSFLLTKDGLEIQPVVSPCTINTSLGIMKFSPNGKKIAITNSSFADSNKPCIQIYNFDNSSGKISNELNLKDNFNSAYGLEFSKNSIYLYVHYNNDNGHNFQLNQFNIVSGNIKEITDSKYTIIENIPISGMQLGPDNKIYISGGEYLHIIQKPNEKGINCDFSLNEVNLMGRKSYLGLPPLINNYHSDYCNNLQICERETLILSGSYYSDAYIEWSGPNNFFSLNYKPIIFDTKPEMSGMYYYTIKKNDTIIENDSIKVTIKPLEKILFENNSELILTGNSLKLKVVENPDFTKIKWYGIDSDQNEVEITKNGTYSVVTENESGCRDSASIKIKIYSAYCIGNDILLDSYHIEPDNPAYKTDYLWSGPNGFTSIAKNPLLENVNETYSGEYNVRIITKLGSGDFGGERDTIFTKVPVLVYGDLALEISAANTNLCYSDSAKISAKQKYAEYLWSTGEISETITVSDAGIYSLIAKNEFGCADTAEIEIKKYGANLIFNKEKLIFDELCLGENKIEELRFKIESISSVKINRIYFKTNNFTIENENSYIKEYVNGDNEELSVNFKPLDAAEYYDTLVLEMGEPCFYSFSVPVYGSSKALFRFALPDIMTDAGSKIEIPIKAALLCPNAENLLSDYEIEITIDKEYFVPDSVQYGTFTETSDGINRIIKVKANAEFEKLSGEMKIINIIYGRALIGRSDVVPLTIQNVDFTNERYFPEYLNGTLKINGCVNDLSGLIMFKKTDFSISPNPTDGNLKVTVRTQEEGKFSIKIYDIQGREVAKKEFSRTNLNYEELDYSFNISSLGTGVYSVQLTAPWTLLQKEVVIEK